MFGGTDRDKRDFVMGLAGLSAGLHALRILAEQGLAPYDDVVTAQTGLKAVLREMPEGQVDEELLAGLRGLIDNLGVAALEAEAKKSA